MKNTQLNKALLNLIESIGAITQEISDLAPNSLARKNTLFIVPNGMDINEIHALSHYLHEFTGLATALKSSDKDHALLEAGRLINFLGEYSSSHQWVFHLPQLKHLVNSIQNSKQLSYASFDKLMIKEKRSATGASLNKKPQYGYHCFKGSANDGFDRLHLHRGLIDSVTQVKEALEQSSNLSDPGTTAIDLTPELAELLIIISTINTEIRNYAAWSTDFTDEILSYWEINCLADCVLKICDAAKALNTESLTAVERQSKIKDIAQLLKPHLEKTNGNPFALGSTVDRQSGFGVHTHTGITHTYIGDTFTFKKWPEFIKNILFKMGVGCINIGKIEQVVPVSDVAKDSSAPSRLHIPTNTIKTLKYIEHKLKPTAE